MSSPEKEEFELSTSSAKPAGGYVVPPLQTCNKAVSYTHLSQKVNDDLSRYYEALGYPAVGECIDGAYVGIKREKPLNG